MPIISLMFGLHYHTSQSLPDQAVTLTELSCTRKVETEKFKVWRKTVNSIARRLVKIEKRKPWNRGIEPIFQFVLKILCKTWTRRPNDSFAYIIQINNNEASSPVLMQTGWWEGNARQCWARPIGDKWDFSEMNETRRITRKSPEKPIKEGSEKSQGQISGPRRVKVIVGLSSVQHCRHHTATLSEIHTDLMKTASFSNCLRWNWASTVVGAKLREISERRAAFSFALAWSEIARWVQFCFSSRRRRTRFLWTATTREK